MLLIYEQALLKLAAPDMNSDEDIDSITDEVIPEFNIMHALTGCMELNFGETGKNFKFEEKHQMQWIKGESRKEVLYEFIIIFEYQTYY